MTTKTITQVARANQTSYGVVGGLPTDKLVFDLGTQSHTIRTGNSSFPGVVEVKSGTLKLWNSARFKRIVVKSGGMLDLTGNPYTEAPIVREAGGTVIRGIFPDEVSNVVTHYFDGNNPYNSNASPIEGQPVTRFINKVNPLDIMHSSSVVATQPRFDAGRRCVVCSSPSKGFHGNNTILLNGGGWALFAIVQALDASATTGRFFTGRSWNVLIGSNGQNMGGIYLKGQPNAYSGVHATPLDTNIHMVSVRQTYTGVGAAQTRVIRKDWDDNSVLARGTYHNTVSGSIFWNSINATAGSYAYPIARRDYDLVFCQAQPDDDTYNLIQAAVAKKRNLASTHLPDANPYKNTDLLVRETDSGLERLWS